LSKREQEGFVPVDGFRVWYRSVGGGSDQEGVPLLILHGGPGAPYDYLENLEAMASDRQRVIFYDQLGCGRSDHPDDPSLCEVSRFADEVGTVRQELGLEHVNILGQSWGGMLAIEYALRQPSGPVSLILANTSVDYQNLTKVHVGVIGSFRS
jgi:proline-specific peptidase